ncbi:ATPase [Aureococcus anophagefferens]|nr:ATPase [Aureococcus anophagefferens]
MPPWVPDVPERKPLLHGNDGSSLFSGDLFADGLGVSAVGGAPILCDVSCGWRRGCLSAIMGGSGVGKTTLLSVLVGDLDESCVRGFAGLGGGALSAAARRSCAALVPQDDVMLTTLTPRQILTYAAALRGVGPRRVEALLSDLGLRSCADTVVGDYGAEGGVSGGERKRCSIGMELIDEDAAQILAADEPTSGLDSSLAESVVETLARTARGSLAKLEKDLEGGGTGSRARRVVLCTIHQPSWRVLKRFDSLTLLAGRPGRVAYHGRVDAAERYFFAPRLAEPAASSAADASFSVVALGRLGWAMDDPRSNPIDEISRRLRDAAGAKEAVDAWARGTSKAAGGPEAVETSSAGHHEHAYGTSLLTQTRVLFRRTMADFSRNKARQRSTLTRPLLAIIAGGLFWRRGHRMTDSDVQTVCGCLALVMIQTNIQIMGATCLQIPKLKALVKREHGNGLYGVFPLPPRVAIFALTVYGVILSGAFLGTLVGSFCDTLEKAREAYLPPFYYANPLQYAYSILAINEFHGVSFADSSDCDEYERRLTNYTRTYGDDAAIDCFATGDDFLSSVDLHEDQLDRDGLCFAALFVAIVCGAYVALHHNVSRRVKPEKPRPFLGARRDRRARGRGDDRRARRRQDAPAAVADAAPAPDLSAAGLVVAVGPPAAEKVILQSVSATWRAAECGAVMGGSGAGKSTLLHTLIGDVGASAGRRVASGRVLLGRVSAAPVARRGGSRLVPQDDVMLTTLTPRQILAFTALLRGVRGRDAEAAVDEILELLGLKTCADTKIGCATCRGVSGGERKRCSIGMELIGHHSGGFGVLAADEPTTGLDSTRAEEVSAMLRKVSRRTKIVVLATIHQPSMRTLERSFDTVTLLHGGRVAYHGRVDAVVAYFAAHLAWRPDEKENPLDFFMNKLREDADGAAAKWRAKGDVLTYGVGYGRQFGFLLARCAVDFVSNPGEACTFLGTRLVIGVIFGLLWWDVGSEPVESDDISTINALFFNTIGLAMCNALIQTILYVPGIKSVLRREARNGLYALFPVSADFEPSRQKAIAIFMLLFTFCGLLIPYNEMKAWAKYCYDVDPLQSTYSALLIAYYEGCYFGEEVWDGTGRYPVSCPSDLVDSGTCFNTGAQYLDNLHLGDDTYDGELGVSFISQAVFAVLAIVAFSRATFDAQ